MTVRTRIDSYVSGTQTNLRGDSVVQADLTLEGVRAQLFDWTAVEAGLTATAISIDGVTSTPVASHKAITRSDTGAVVGIVGSGYKVHDYSEWLTRNVAAMLDTDDLVIRSAGTLNGGARAFVQVGTPEGIMGPGGVEYLPILGSYTSLDSSIATTYKGNRVVVICENTYAMALGESGEGVSKMSIRHTKNSAFDVLTAREALGLVFANADAFNAELEQLLAIRVSDNQLRKIGTQLFAGTTDSARSKSMAERKLGEVMQLWRTDARVVPWKGTAFGAMQALNTWRQHIATVKGATRDERNMTNVMLGTSDKADHSDLALIRSVVGA